MSQIEERQSPISNILVHGQTSQVEQLMPKIDKISFTKKISRKQSLAGKQSITNNENQVKYERSKNKHEDLKIKALIQIKKETQFFDENQYRLHAISSRNQNRSHVTMKVPDNQNALLINSKKELDVKVKKSSKNALLSNKSLMLSGKRTLLSRNKSVELEQNEAKFDVRDLYNKYLTSQQAEIHRARRQLQNKMNKYLPTNSSFSKFYQEKQAMVDKEAVKQQGQLNDKQNLLHNTIDYGAQKQNRINQRKIKLNEILNNKRIDFNNKLRERGKAHSSGAKTNSQMLVANDTQVLVAKKSNETLNLERQKSQSGFMFNQMNSPTYSDGSELQNKFNYFPQPKKNSKQSISVLSPYKISVSPHKTSITPSQKSVVPSQKSLTSLYHIQTLSSLQQESLEQTKRSFYLINSSKKKQQQFSKAYDLLDNQTTEVIYGFSNLKLDEENSDSYMDQLRDMWMNNDLSKGKGNKKKNRLDGRKQNGRGRN